MSSGIHIVAVGARTPLGFTANSSFAAIRAGISQISEIYYAIDKNNDPVRMALDHELDGGLTGPERMIKLSESALEEVLNKVNFKLLGIREISLFLALPAERPGWDKNITQEFIKKLQLLRLPIKLSTVEVFANGHAAGLLALDVASAWIKNRKCQMCIVLGVDSYLNFDTLEWLDNNKQLANSYNRGAFFPGEGACAIILSSFEIVNRFSLDSLATVIGIANSIESKSIKTDNICLGEGLTECVTNSTKTLKLPQEKIDGVICDINGERYRAEEWGFVILRCGDKFIDSTDYFLPATYWGDVGAASGPLFIGIAIAAGKKKWAKGLKYMIWNSSEGGERAAVVLKLNGLINSE